MGAVQTLIVFENEPTMRVTVKNASTGEEKVLHLDKAGEANQSNFVASDGAELETIEKVQLVEVTGRPLQP